MIAALLKRLGLDRLDEILAEEVRKAQMQVLQEERAFVLRQIAKLDERIRDLGGKRRPGRPRSAASTPQVPTVASSPKKRAARKRGGRKSGSTVQDFARKALSDGGSATMPQIVERLRKAGYKGKATPSNLRIMLVRALKDREFFRKVKRGVYRLRSGTADQGKAKR